MRFVSLQTPWHRHATRVRGSDAWRIGMLPVLLALACADPAGAPAPIPPGTPIVFPVQPVDLRFKGVGRLATTLRSTVGLSPGAVQVYDGFGTPLEITPCAAPSSIPSCYWSFAVSDSPAGTEVSTIYYSAEASLSRLETDLAAVQQWAFNPYPSQGQDYNSVITSLMIDEPSNVYGTSGLQTSQMREYDLAWGSLAPSELQAAASNIGAQGRVITAVAFKADKVLYLSYGWARASTFYAAKVVEAKVVRATFDTAAQEAANLAGSGYIITAIGGNYTDGFLLVGTRVPGGVMTRPLKIATDSIASQSYERPEVGLAREGYTIVGGIFGGHAGSTRMFNMLIGEK